MPEEKKGLNNTTIALMICVALFYDALQVLLTPIFMGWLVSIFAGLTFYVWFKMRGLNFVTPKRAGLLGGGFIIELIPILNVLPAWTLAIVLLALDSKIKKIATVVPGGEMAVGALSNKARLAQTNRNISSQADQIKQPDTLKRNSNYAPPQANNQNARAFPQRLEEWKNTSNKLSDAETRGLANRTYKGGMEKYKKDDEKITADRLRMEEGHAKLKNARAAYLDEDKNLNKAA